MKDARILIVVFVATVLITVVTALIAPPEGPGANAPTSFSSAPAGGKAGFLTLRALGYAVDRSFEPIAELKAEPKETVLLISGELRPSDQDKRAMQAFVAAGGVVLLSGASGAEFLGFEDVYDDQSLVSTPVVTHRVVTPSPIVDGVTEITISALEDEITFGSEHVSLFSQTGQQPLVTTAVVGAGRVVWLSAPTPFMNEHITNADNLQLLLNVAGRPGERQVLWDEHYHGNTRSLWSYAVNTPLPWMGAQIGLIVGCAVFAFGRRRAPVRPRVDVPRTSSLEFIEMLGALYRRSNAASAAVSAARARFLRAVTSVCGVSADRGDEAVARAVGAKLDIDAAQALRTLAMSRTANTTDTIERKAAMDLTRQLQTLTTQLYALRKMRRPASTGHQES
jgi:hypothetical protein